MTKTMSMDEPRLREIMGLVKRSVDYSTLEEVARELVKEVRARNRASAVVPVKGNKVVIVHEEDPLLDKKVIPFSLAVKLACLAVHVEEFLSDDGHSFDVEACRGLVQDEGVQGLIEDVRKRAQALLPVKRKG
jgi:hypothetical protein